MNIMLWQILAARAVEGTLSEGEARQLLAMCRESTEARDALVRVMAVERLLPLAASDPLGTLTAREVAERLEGGDTLSIEIAWRATERARRWLWHRRIRRVAACAAAVVVLTWAGWWLVGAMTPAASIAGSEGVRWVGRSPLVVSSDLSQGSRLRAEAGLLALDFHSGAHMVLEAPFDVELRDGLSAVLHEGRLTVNCPHSAKGFAVETAQGTVVDRGTEFCVEMIKDGLMEVQVLSGRVDAITQEEGSTPLLEGESLQIGGQGRQMIRGVADAGRFVTALPDRKNRATGFIHWSFDQGAGSDVPNTGRGLGAGVDTTLHLLAYPERKPVPGKGPSWLEGAFGSGLKLDGKTGFGETEFRGIGGRDPRTVALWVRVGRDLKEEEGLGIISWGLPHGAGAWQVSANTDPAQGLQGRLRLGTFDGGIIVGTTDLRDDHWHHIAVVMYSGSRPSLASNVLLYVDGHLEAVSRKGLKEIDTDTLDAAHGVWVGRNIVYPDKPGQVNPHAKFFRGDVDEVFIFDDALTGDEIARLMRTNQAP